MSNNIPTPHIEAKLGDFAKTVLMPGDPKRSKFVAEKYFENAVLVNDVRGVQGYTGYYKGKRVSVMASGMGMPSMGIYSYELFNFYGVENIIRIGSAGAIFDGAKLRDIFIASGAFTNSSYAYRVLNEQKMFLSADNGLVEKAVGACKKANKQFKVGNVLTTDFFYNDIPYDGFKDMGVLAVEMETAALYLNAFQANKKEVALCTVSDVIETGERLTSAERENTFTDMIGIALDIAE